MNDTADQAGTAARTALLVSTSTYADPGLKTLVAPEAEVERLAQVLGDPEVGAFQVHTVVNQPTHLVTRAIEEHFSSRRLDDFVLLHISCHGIKDADGQLYLAAADTQRRLPASTTVPARFLVDQLNRCRARTIGVLLDCCYSGAFVSGIRGDPDLHLGEQLHRDVPGRGLVVITATDAVQYAWDADEQTGEPTGFTTALIHGLQTGEADLDEDGRVSQYDLFAYLEDKVRRVRPDQHPRMWEFDVQGTIWIAEATHRPRRATAAESEIVLVADDDYDIARFIDVNLRLEGFATIVCHDGEDALNKALDLQPNLIVLDVMMPRMDGYEVCTKLRADGRSAHIPVIMLTGKSLSADKVLGLTAGADDYVTKPFDPMELIARVKTTLRRAAQLEERGARRAAGYPVQ